MKTSKADPLTKLGKLKPAISRRKLNGKARYAPHKLHATEVRAALIRSVRLNFLWY